MKFLHCVILSYFSIPFVWAGNVAQWWTTYLLHMCKTLTVTLSTAKEEKQERERRRQPKKNTTKCPSSKELKRWNLQAERLMAIENTVHSLGSTQCQAYDNHILDSHCIIQYSKKPTSCAIVRIRWVYVWIMLRKVLSMNWRNSVHVLLLLLFQLVFNIFLFVCVNVCVCVHDGEMRERGV